TVGLPTGGKANLKSVSAFGDNNFHSVDLPKTWNIVENAGAEWNFPSPVAGDPGVQYVTGSTGSDGPSFVDQDITSSAIYGKQFRLTVDTSPAAAATGNTTLTPSQWVGAGQTVGINADAFV